VPVWACFSAGSLAALPVLRGIERLLIVADSDEDGLKAAWTCAERWSVACEVRIWTSPNDWHDLNDDLGVALLGRWISFVVANG
jgi:Toprim domain-containing protein